MATPSLTEDDADALWGDLNEAFSPGAPVLERELFAGRIEQLHSLIDSVQQRGRHAIVFGERGVGKTSLVNVLKLAMHAPTRPVLFAKVNADPEDTFNSLWRKIFKRITFDMHTAQGYVRRTLGENYYSEYTPDDVLLELSSIPPAYVPIVVIDEFDRLKDERPTMLLADTVKALSDYSSSATIVVVGVAEDVGEIIKGHQSIARAMVQVRMPRMSPDELAQIIRSRYAKCGISCDEEALWKMTFLARGLPFYAQLLGLHSARAAIATDRTRIVTAEHTATGLKSAVNELDQTIKETYLSAIRSQRGDTLYAPVLLACALAKGDELGSFQQIAVSDPLNRILPGKNYKAATFAFHMNEFCEPSRKQVLERDGEPRAYRYRFTDPLMQPFIIMKGLAEGLIDDLTAEVYANRRQLELSTGW